MFMLVLHIFLYRFKYKAYLLLLENHSSTQLTLSKRSNTVKARALTLLTYSQVFSGSDHQITKYFNGIESK